MDRVMVDFNEDVYAYLDKLIEEKQNNPLDIHIKYLDPDVTRLNKISQGDWIDVYSAETVFIPEGSSYLVPLGFCMKLPEGYEAHLAARSSTFKKWGIILTNSVGIIDESYCGDNDQWMLSAYCLQGRDNFLVNGDETKGSFINKNDKIAQFRIMKKMPPVNFVEVSSLGNKDRGGFGSTGTR